MFTILGPMGLFFAFLEKFSTVSPDIYAFLKKFATPSTDQFETLNKNGSTIDQPLSDNRTHNFPINENVSKDEADLRRKSGDQVMQHLKPIGIEQLYRMRTLQNTFFFSCLLDYKAGFWPFETDRATSKYTQSHRQKLSRRS
jgi:hypothetical protein